MSAPLAAIDIGTNTVLCLVARKLDSGGLEVLDDACATARLGEGLARTGTLSDAAIERTLAILEGQLAHARSLGAEDVHAVGTAVLRRASDSGRFLDACRDRLGLEVRVIAEAEEARLGHAAVSGTGGRETIVLDVGGGSSEVMTDGGDVGLSAPVGAVVLTERFFGYGEHPPVEEGGLSALVVAIAQEMSCYPAGAAKDRELVLLGGTAANLACLELGTDAFDVARAEGAVLDPKSAARWAAKLADMSLAERKTLPIEADRAEILPAGLACIAGGVARLEAASLRVTGRGLRYGLLLES